MEVRFEPEVESRLEELAALSGINADQLVREVMSEYLGRLAETRELLARRYDELKSGQVNTTDPKDARARLLEKAAARRSGAA